MALTNWGTPSPNNYEIGRGRLLLDLFVSGTATGKYVDIGNVSALTLSSDEETLDHTSSLEGLASTDVTVTLNKSLKGSFTAEEITKENLSSFFTGDLTTTTQDDHSASPIAGSITINTADRGKWLKLYDNGGNSPLTKTAQPIFNITTITVSNKTEGTDFEVDYDFGLIRLIAGTSITAETCTIYCNAATFDKVQMLTQTTVNARVIFLGEDAYTGKKKILRLHKIKLSGSGDAAQIGDEWSQLNFEFTVEKDTSYDSNSPYGHIQPIG